MASSNIRQLPPKAVLYEYPDRLGLRVTMVQIAIYADLAPRLSELGLTSPSRMTALSHISAKPGCNQTELGLFTGLSRASAMTMVDQLESAGLIVRSATTDARVNALHLTDRGEAALVEARARTAINEEAVFGGLSSDERATLKQLLDKIIDRCAEYSEKNRPTSSIEGSAMNRIAKFTLVSLLAWPIQALAQEDLGEVVVTARRVNERLQDVPVAVTAFTSGSLQARGVDSLDQIAKYTPNIRFDGAAQLSGGNYNSTVFVRGVGQNDFAIFSDPGVGFYVDDVYYARSIGGIMDAVDIDSVQVLRGPQGTLFGKNTVGGAVLITTAKPELDAVSGSLEGTTGRFNRADLKGAINVPLVKDVLALRVSGALLNRDGYVKRLFDGGEQGDRNADMIRAKLRYRPNDRLTVDLGADYTRARETSAPSDLLAVGDSPGITGVPFLVNYNRFVAPTRGVVAPDGQRTLNPSFITRSPYQTWAGGGPNRNDLDLWGVQGTAAYELGGATLKSISAYRHMTAFFARDGDNTPFVFRQTTNDDTQWQFSQELQLSGKTFDNRVSYVLGGFYFKEKASDIATADLAIGLSPPLALTPPFTPAVFIQNYVDNKGWALFGQADFKLTDSLSITAGGRYTHDDKAFTSINVRQRDNVEFINTTVGASFKKFTPKLGLNYTVKEGVLLYGSWSKGFKQGGFNGRPLVSAAEVTKFLPEQLETYEVGLKSQWFERRLTANLVAFHSLYKDIQLTVNQTPINFVANAAAGKIDGVEAELVARPTGWFTVNLATGFLEARYTSVGQGLGPTQILPINLNSHFVKAPKWTVSVGAEIRHSLNGAGELTLRGDLTKYSRIYQDVANTPLITDDGYTLVNARLSYDLPGGRVQLAVFGSNLTKALYLASGNASGAFGLAEASYGRPREWGISASYRF